MLPRALALPFCCVCSVSILEASSPTLPSPAHTSLPPLAMSPEEWYKTLPPLTKIYWTAAVATTILTSIGVINPMHLFLDMDMVVGKFNVRDAATQRAGA